jgi:hypothetical protein
MLDPRFVWLGAAVNLIAGAMAVWAILQGRARPNRVTWLVWATAGWIAFIAQIGQGVVLPAVLTGVVATIPTAILLTSLLTGHGTWWENRLDQLCLALALVLVVLWQLVGSGEIGIAMSIAVHALAAVPTLTKVWRDPRSEPHIPYTAGMVNAGITLLTLPVFTFATAGFAVYFLTLCTVLAALILVVPRLRASTTAPLPGSPTSADPATAPPTTASTAPFTAAMTTDSSPAESITAESITAESITAEAAAFAAAFVADYLSWDEEHPQLRGRALVKYWPGPHDPGTVDVLAFIGWEHGRGRQVVTQVLPGACQVSPSGLVTVGVRARVALMRRRPLPSDALPPDALPLDPASGDVDPGPAVPSSAGLPGPGSSAGSGSSRGVVANAPSTTDPAWEVHASCWWHVAVHVAQAAGRLVIQQVEGSPATTPTIDPAQHDAGRLVASRT